MTRTRTAVARIPVVKQVPVDFVFLIDATRGDGIDSIRNAATRLIRDRLGCGKRDCRVAVADYRGFPTSASGEPGEDAFILRCGFTTDAEEAIRSLNAISADGENDAAESVYSAIASCLEGSGSKLGGWRREAVKTIALVCDAEPRDVYTAEAALIEPKSGYSRLATFTLTVGTDNTVSKVAAFSKIKAEE